MRPTSLFRLLLLLLLWSSGAALAQQTLFKAPYAADMCAADRFGSNLGCTAADVKITKILITPGSNPPAGCVAGAYLTLDLDITVQFGANSRYDVGIFMSQDGGNPQTLSTRSIAGGTGSAMCKVSVLPAPPFTNLELSSPADTCGDGNANLLATFTIPQVQVKCQSLNSNFLNIPFVVTWDQSQSPTNSKGNNGEPPLDGICVGPSSPVPGTVSKCSASTGADGEVQIVALPTITKSDSVTSMSPGDTTTYTVTILNNSGSGITNAVFRDPLVPNLAVSSVTCTAQNATCPASVTVAGMQAAAGLTVPTLNNGGTVTFVVQAALTGGPAENPTNQVTNTASITVAGVTNSAFDTNTIVYPALVNQKQVTTISDPVRGTAANALSIPGAVARYTISVTNTGLGRVDTHSTYVTDAIPANTSLYVSMPGATNCSAVSAPVTFTDGSPTSALTFAAANLKYSTDNGATWVAAPPAWVFHAASGTVPAGCSAPSVTHIQANPQGRMAAASAFTLNFLVLVK